MAEDFIRQAHLGCGFVVINPGAGWPSKTWPADWYGAVAKHVGQTRSLPTVVVWAGDEERRVADRIVARSGGHAVGAPSTNLLELAAVLREARIVLGSDTGPLHLAVAVGTPCVGLYGPTRPEDCGPYGPGHISLQAFYQAGASRQRRRARNDAMRAITVESVCAACDQMLDRQAGGLTATHAA